MGCAAGLPSVTDLYQPRWWAWAVGSWLLGRAWGVAVTGLSHGTQSWGPETRAAMGPGLACPPQQHSPSMLSCPSVYNSAVACPALLVLVFCCGQEKRRAAWSAPPSGGPAGLRSGGVSCCGAFGVCPGCEC